MVKRQLKSSETDPRYCTSATLKCRQLLSSGEYYNTPTFSICLSEACKAIGDPAASLKPENLKTLWEKGSRKEYRPKVTK